MDASGNQTLNNTQTQTTSPFAPVDIPDLNNIAAPSAMPPMGVVDNLQESAMAQQMAAGNYAASMSAGGMQQGAGGMQQQVQTNTQDEQSMQRAMAQVTQGTAQGTQAAANVAGKAAARTMTNAAGQAVNPVSQVPAQNVQTGQTGSQSQMSQPVTTAGSSTASKQDAAVTMADIPKPAVKSEAEEKGAGVSDLAKAALAGATAKTVADQATKKSTEKKAEHKDGEDSKVKDVEVASSSLPKAVVEKDDGVTIEPLLEECIRRNASDLHLQVGLPPILRLDGVLQPMTTYPVLDNEAVEKLVFSTLDEDQQKILMKDKEFDYSFAFGDLGRFRVNAFHEKGNMAAAFRLIPNVIKSIEDLGLPGVVSTFADRPNGLVLVTGPTGSGKSTTLAALIDRINTEKALHIITIEDPIEFTHQSKRSVVAQREVHYDTYSFSVALRSILREDPDVVLIGEMRDLETIQAAITVAETGHLVFATLHTNSAAQSIDRMIDVFPAHQQPQIRAQLASILVGICSQRLVPAIDGGRIAIAEVLVANAAVRNIIREGKTHQLDMAIQTGAEQGMQTMDRELAKYVRGGIISYDVAREFTVDGAEFDRLARG